MNGSPAKPATTVHVGDRIEARIAQRHRVVVVVQVIQTRVGAPIAVECYEDHSPVVERLSPEAMWQRDKGAGRPTKRDRRQIDRLRRSS